MPRQAVGIGLICLGLWTNLCLAQEARIEVQVDQVSHRLSRYLTGACIEDVNHEIYGGIYSQMVFGESFQEPAPIPAIKGFTAFGGDWQVKEGELSVSRFPGPKLIADQASFSEGEAGVEILLPGKSGGVAGLLVKVREAGPGTDQFIGYEISLDSERQVLVLGRHRHNWEPIQNVPCEIAVDQWIPLAVRMREQSLEVLVHGRTILHYADKQHPLAAGQLGLRPFNRACRYRHLWVKTANRTKALEFETVPNPNGGVSGMWRPLKHDDVVGHFELSTNRPFISRQSQVITHEQGEGEIGIENRGLNRRGMNFIEGKPYEGYLWARCESPARIYVAMENGNTTQPYAETSLVINGNEWQRCEFALTPRANDSAGRLSIKLKQPGSIILGHVFLQPGEWGRFRSLPVRRDVVEALIKQGLTVLRYGGSMVNAPEYRWEKMIGPRDRRPPYRGTWYPCSSNGWGIIDFLNLCEAAGFLAIPAFNMDETPEAMAHFVEYANGTPDSPWVRKRVADGHSVPYRLKYLELGNEEAVNEDYWRRFKPLAEAIWANDKNIIIVVGDFAYNGRIEDPYHFKGAPAITSLAVHRQILELAQANHRPIAFDVHVWNNEPRNPDELGGGIIGLRDFIAALGKLCPGADYQVCVFEENAGNPALRRGLGHAHAINELERCGGRVPIVCAANCLQPYRQNDNGWDQGMLFLTPSQVWGQPSYYVTQIISQNYLPLCLMAEVQSPNNALDVTAKKSDDGKILTLQVVNLENRALPTRIAIRNFVPSKPVGTVCEIKGQLNDLNTPDDTRRIVPQQREWRHGGEVENAAYVFPPYSFTLIRLE